VNGLLESGEAAWCPAVRLELWRGVTNDAERKTLRRYQSLLPDYEISAEVWNRSIQLADRARSSGVTVPLADLLIFACARIHGLDVAHDDAHFDELAKLEE
jgi:predicted nucleic acid-binding protein